MRAGNHRRGYTMWTASRKARYHAEGDTHRTLKKISDLCCMQCLGYCLRLSPGHYLKYRYTKYFSNTRSAELLRTQRAAKA